MLFSHSKLTMNNKDKGNIALLTGVSYPELRLITNHLKSHQDHPQTALLQPRFQLFHL
mgnify:CR=1 FL=1